MLLCLITFGEWEIREIHPVFGKVGEWEKNSVCNNHKPKNLFYSLPILTMKIIINDVSYDTQRSETICERFSERVDDSEIELFHETIYRTKDGKYFNYIWWFRDSEENIRNREDLFTEYIRTMEPEDVILWLRID